MGFAYICLTKDGGTDCRVSRSVHAILWGCEWDDRRRNPRTPWLEGRDMTHINPCTLACPDMFLKCFLVSRAWRRGREACCDELRSEWHEEDDFLRQLQELHGTGARLLGETKESDLMESWKPCRSQMFQMNSQLHVLNMFLFWNQMLEYAVVINWFVACLTASSHPDTSSIPDLLLLSCVRLHVLVCVWGHPSCSSFDLDGRGVGGHGRFQRVKSQRGESQKKRKIWNVGCRWILNIHRWQK